MKRAMKKEKKSGEKSEKTAGCIAGFEYVTSRPRKLSLYHLTVSFYTTKAKIGFFIHDFDQCLTFFLSINKKCTRDCNDS